MILDEPLSSLPNGTRGRNIPRLVYKSLDYSRREIRLLKLAPGARDAEIRCTLTHASLENKPTYEALSYTWGDAEDRRHILFDGYDFSITANLDVALRYLRKLGEVRTLWVDALCINQEDLEERSHQVRMMRDIFWSARGVLAWTGEPDERSDEALDLLQLLGQPSVFMSAYTSAANPDTFSKIDFQTNWGKWDSLFKFLNRPYWSRVWIVQELAVPGSGIGNPGWSDNGKVQIGCGFTWLPICTFNVACATLGQFLRPILSSVTNLSRANPYMGDPAGFSMFEVVQCCILNAKRQRLSIMELLWKTNFLKATDPRDRVYALIALARDKDQDLVPNYSISTTQMLRELVRHVILTDKNLMVLSGNRLPSPKVIDEPSSWTPDPERVIPSSRSDWAPETTLFKASGLRVPAITFSKDLKFLTVKGIIVDKIDTVIGPCRWKKFPGLLSEDLPYSEPTNSCLELEQYGSSLSASERDKLWHTLVLDSMELGHGRRISPAPAIIGHWFEVLLKSSSVVANADKTFDATKQFYNQIGFIDRCFYATTSKRMGVGPYGTLQGDLVVILYGGQFCYILREVGEHYVFIGDAYLHGAMHGELFHPVNQRQNKVYQERDFVLR